MGAARPDNNSPKRVESSWPKCPVLPRMSPATNGTSILMCRITGSLAQRVTSPRSGTGRVGNAGDPPVKRFVFAKSVCANCPLASVCIGKSYRGGGRAVFLHPQEHQLQAARKYQATEEFRRDITDRQVVEHRLARLTQLGIRQARYFGRSKTRLQVLLAAVVANLTLLGGIVRYPAPTMGDRAHSPRWPRSAATISAILRTVWAVLHRALFPTYAAPPAPRWRADFRRGGLCPGL